MITFSLFHIIVDIDVIPVGADLVKVWGVESELFLMIDDQGQMRGTVSILYCYPLNAKVTFIECLVEFDIWTEVCSHKSLLNVRYNYGKKVWLSYNRVISDLFIRINPGLMTYLFFRCALFSSNNYFWLIIIKTCLVNLSLALSWFCKLLTNLII